MNLTRINRFGTAQATARPIAGIHTSEELLLTLITNILLEAHQGKTKVRFEIDLTGLDQGTLRAQAEALRRC